ncbi:radical SAM/SPASM domain-containing protein [Aliarcobacter butzleri]|uniref:radical SAM/SPASM domain-containing protein n=1 Tax=Aliarcobacter butzleri TaxID=28197 RepID=UPI003B223220
MKNRFIPINKGNYSSFETKLREELFDKYKSETWEQEYKEYRKNWEEYPKNQFVSKYPLLVDIELASVCNLKCPMCYTITDEFKDKVNAKLMDFELFKRIINEIGGKVPALRLSLRGESTLHPKFIECIKYAKDKGIKEVSTLTNGSKLKLDFFKKIVEAGIDWITISVDGLDEEYERIRKPLKFKDTFEKITQMNRYKLENNLHKPVIKIQSLWPAIKNNPTKFYNTFEPITDLIAFNPLIDYLQKDSDIVYIDNFSCPQLYQRLVIGADGLAMMCSNDEENSHIVGNANKETVYEIWHGEALNKVRELHKQEDGYKNLDVCRKCYLPRATEATETSEVNGRKFDILNYVNRIQNIGE